jgi:NTE family protein
MRVTDRALVLGGGGVAGIGWMVGLVCGLADAGVDVHDADLVVGTSAGSVVGALVATGVSCDDMWAGQTDPTRQSTEIFAEVDLEEMAARFMSALAGASSQEQVRAQVGAMALATKTLPEAERRAVIASRLPVQTWPEGRLLIPVVDAESGQDVVLDSSCGFPLVDVVAASCAVPGVWPPVTLGARRYIDGGVRTAVNADLAAGASAVLVIAPMGLTGRGPLTAGMDDARPLLEAAGRVVEIEPDESSRAAMGTNPLDPATREPAAGAGRAQAAGIADVVRDLWRSRS